MFNLTHYSVLEYAEAEGHIILAGLLRWEPYLVEIFGEKKYKNFLAEVKKHEEVIAEAEKKHSFVHMSDAEIEAFFLSSFPKI